MSNVVNLNQTHFRVRTDTGTVAGTPTWAAAEDVAVSIAVETPFSIRFSFQNTGTLNALGPFPIRVSKNGGAYTAVTASTGATLGAQSEPTASSDADETVITTASFRLTASAGTAAAGRYDETGSSTGTLALGAYTEFEYGLILKAAGATVGNTFDFRIYNTSTVFNTYTQTPRVTVRALVTGTDFSEKTGVASTYGDYVLAGHAAGSVITLATDGHAAIGDLVVLAYGSDNVSASSGGDVEATVASIIDSKGNTWTKGYTANFGAGGSQTGAAVGVYYTQVTTALVAGDTITVDYLGDVNRDAIAKIVKVFTVAGGKTVSVEAVNQANGNASTPPSLDATTANVECLRVRFTSFETNTPQPLASTGWYALPMATANSGGTSTLGMSLSGEFKISTGTSDASTPVAGATVDQASVYVAFKAAAAVDTEDDLLANNVSSASNVGNPAVQQVHAILANDVASPSSVTQPVLGIRRDVLADDVISASSVSVPTVTQIVPPIALLANDVVSASSVTQPSVQQRQALLANDVASPSSVGQPAAGIRRDLNANDVKSTSSVGQPTATIGRALLANDVKSNSSVSQPTAIIGRTLLANDILSASKVSNPAAIIQRAVLANDVTSASSVTGPVLGILGQTDARDVTSASSVSQPALNSLHGLLANDVASASAVTQSAALILRGLLANDNTSPSSVTSPAVHQRQALDAVNVTSASSVTSPAFAEIAPGVDGLLAEDIVSGSYVSTPTLVEIGGEVEPVPPELGGGGKAYGRGFTRKRWEELLAALERERREAVERAERFRGKDKARAKKAAYAASRAIAAAKEAAEEAASLAHAGDITRMLEGAAQAKSLADYLEQMKAARLAAVDWEMEDDDETILMLVA